MSARWLPVVGHEGLYEVSDFGRVRSLVRDLPGKGGTIRPYGGILLSARKLCRGYPSVTLSKGNLKITRCVHVLVCMAFHGPKPIGKDVVAHNDGDKRNNKASNLRWATQAENVADKRLHGTQHFGEDTNNAKLTASKVHAIRALNGSRRSVARAFDVSPRAIADIRSGRTWGHLV